MSGLSGFQSLRLVGAIIPADALLKASTGAMPGQTPSDYDLIGGLAITAAAARAWEVLLPAHTAWKESLRRLPSGEAGTRITRERWLLPLLYELGYGRVPALASGVDLPAGIGETKGTHYPLSHQLAWPATGEATAALAIHLLGPGIDLDRRMHGVTARAPHPMLQDFLNRSDRHLWGLLSNGQSLRVLRDASALGRQSYIEFDLETIFENQLYADFRLLFTLLHASRLTPRDQDREDAPTPRPENCWLEEWRTTAIQEGARALDALRDGVATALTALGTGFVANSANAELQHVLAVDHAAADQLHRWLLRVAYRLIVLFVAEDRDLLHPPGATPQARDLYQTYFSSGRLRRLAASRTGGRHTDLWDAHQIVTAALGGDGNEELGLPGLAASLYDPDAIGQLRTANLSNRHLLAAVRAISQVKDEQSGAIRPVDYRNLGSEELGSVYEGLLAYIPRYDPVARTFTLTAAPGSERKTSGAFYTGTALIGLILDETLDPLIDQALRESDPEHALLNLTICDPACGSGHFLVAAARRLASALATVRTGEPEPAPEYVRAAQRDVVARCIYGVDRNDLAIEIAKVALWVETLDAGKPLAFLDAHLKVGNALIGATPGLLRLGIPDDAFAVLLGDDKDWTSKLKKRNKGERKARSKRLFNPTSETQAIADTAADWEAAPDDTLAAVRARADAWRRLERDPDLLHAKHLADMWCAAFLQPKQPRTAEASITHQTLLEADEDWESTNETARRTVERLARQYRFFHWHLEFPNIFQVKNDVVPPDATLGWHGGFSAFIGNPPWDTLSPDTREFFGNLVPDIRKLSKSEKDARIAELLKDPTYARRWEDNQRELFGTAHFLKDSGRYAMYAPGNLGKGDFNIYRSFAELALTHAHDGGYSGQILQSGIYAGANASAIRKHLLDRCTWTAVYGFNNKGGTWFPGVALENFGAYAARVGVPSPPRHEIRAAFGMPRPETLRTDLAERALTFEADDIRNQNPDTYAIPDIRDPRAARISRRLYQSFEPIGRQLDGLPHRNYSREIDMGDKNGVFREAAPGLPVYEGRMIDFYDHRAKRYVSGHGNGSLWEETPFGSTRKSIVPQWFVERDDLQNDEVRQRVLQFRIGFMDVADPGRQRSFCSAVIPPDAVCGHKVPTILFPDFEWYVPVYLAIANSLIIDFLARQRTLSKSMSFNILDTLPIARLQTNDPRAQWLAQRALLLTCTSADMTPLWNEMAGYGWVEPFPAGDVPGEQREDQRRLLRSEIDAFLAREVYALARADLELILDSFSQLAGIEVKAHGEYLTRRLVLDAYDRRDWDIRDPPLSDGANLAAATVSR